MLTCIIPTNILVDFNYNYLVPPSLRSPLGNSILGIVTNTITLSLVVDNASPPVRPSNIVWWFKPFSSNTSLTIETGSQYSFSQDRLSLTITYLTHDNEGFYIVMATNEAGYDSIQLTLNIEGLCDNYKIINLWLYLFVCFSLFHITV